MKPDVIERLLLDRALGRLDPDVDALLADYLANDPSAATQARELQAVVRLASEAVRQPVPAVELPSQIHRLVWRHRAEQALALAASFVIGVGITALVLRANFRRENNAVSLAPSIQNASMRSPRLDALVKQQDRVASLLVKPTVVPAGLGVHRRRQRKGDGEMNLRKLLSQRFLLARLRPSRALRRLRPDGLGLLGAGRPTRVRAGGGMTPS